jgi:methylated-DNA-[protein]-cysteine S-methyltransferase
MTTLMTAISDVKRAAPCLAPPGYRIASPLGDIVVCAEKDALTGVFFTGQKYFPALSMTDASGVAALGEPYVVSHAREELAAFFAGELRVFTVPYQATAGTPFQRQVWQELARIPYGESVSYGDIARRLQLPVGTARAIGSANGRNPISIIVPCHRVIASSGALTGYAGGVDRKDALLRLEMRQMQQIGHVRGNTVQSEQFSLLP